MFFPILKNTSNSGRVLIFTLLAVFGIIFGAVLSSAILLLCGDALSELGKLRAAQICSQLVGFVFPPLFYAALVERKPLSYLGFKKMPVWALLGVVAMFAVLPLNSLLSEWNENLTLPESLSAIEEKMRQTQDMANAVTDKMLSVNSLGGMFFNVMMIGAFAAIGEELLFRSILQPFFIKLFKNPHLGIALTAVLFSAIHFEFYGFIPRVVLGFMLGYMFYLSGSIWSSILMHFVNNSTIVVLYYLNFNDIMAVDVENFGSGGTIAIFLSIVGTVAIFILCQRFSKRDVDC